jgi:sensor histidine kinase regulating citrate/malate metabolism
VQLTGEVIPEGYRISVRDQGPGLTPARMAEMQRPLDAVNPTSGVFGGLMVVRQLLHSAGIALNIESQALVGTTMSFVIPPAHV